jgi:hypothetical protein
MPVYIGYGPVSRIGTPGPGDAGAIQKIYHANCTIPPPIKAPINPPMKPTIMLPNTGTMVPIAASILAPITAQSSPPVIYPRAICVDSPNERLSSIIDTVK